MRVINKEIADDISFYLAEIANGKLNLTDEIIIILGVSR